MKRCRSCLTQNDNRRRKCAACGDGLGSAPAARTTHYRRGADFERRVKARLEEQGWTVFRTAGSHSPADLVCVRLPPGCTEGWDDIPQVRFVQCKSGAKPMPRKEREAFRAFAGGLRCEAVVFLRGMKEEAA